MEAAWKIVREHFEAIGQPQRRKAIARNIAYHGVTLGALSFTGVPPFKEAFGPPPIDVTHVSNTNAFRAPDGDDPEAFCARLLAEVRDADRGGRAGRGRADHRRAGPERRRLPGRRRRGTGRACARWPTSTAPC